MKSIVSSRTCELAVSGGAQSQMAPGCTNAGIAPFRGNPNIRTTSRKSPCNSPELFHTSARSFFFSRLARMSVETLKPVCRTVPR